MKTSNSCIRVHVVLAALLLIVAPSHAQESLDLSGRWRFAIDRGDSGVAQRWWQRRLADTIRLPGSMAENLKGDEMSTTTPWAGGIVDKSWYTSDRFAQYRLPGNVKVPFGLTPIRLYQGAAWYQQDVAVPGNWRGKRILLHLERVHWESRAWMDSIEIGMQNGLSTPHEYDLPTGLKPGKHTLTIRVDNRIKDIDIGRNAHSFTDHTQTDWNGIVGRLALDALPPVNVGDIRIDPDILNKTIRIRASIAPIVSKLRSGTMLTFRVLTDALPRRQMGRTLALPIIGSNAQQSIDTLLALGPDAELWDEFHPACYVVQVGMNVPESKSYNREILFGLRSFTASGTRFHINGRPTFLRGTLDCCMFPLTGYPSTRVADWLRIMGTIKRFGMNHVRFHSWCPPEAAFVAADRLGLYLQIECSVWTRVGNGRPVDEWVFEESERIVRAYGNHPSFCMMASGNEPSGPNMNTFLDGFVGYWKERDRRRVYTSAAGWPQLEHNDYQSTMYPRIQVWGLGLESVINREPPQTVFDFREVIAKETVPVVAHETGQWCAFPDLREIPAYRGVLRAGNYEIIRDDLASRGMLALADSFVAASGKLQTLCYKADIEAALRTPGMAGFQLLGLHDFPGQGTAPVGVLNVFSEPKGYATDSEFRRFCSATVPLVRMKTFVFTTRDTLLAKVEVSHFGATRLTGVTSSWSITGAGGTAVGQGSWNARDIEIDNCQSVGDIDLPLSGFVAPGRFTLTVRIGDAANAWDFWVYPAPVDDRSNSSVLTTNMLDSSIAARLEGGATVLLSLGKGRVTSGWGGEVAVGFSSIFWNTVWTSGQAPHTLGILCNPSHPALAAFPTSFFSESQWWDIVSHASAINLDSLNLRGRPLVRFIDDWNANRNLALLCQARVGKGKLLICGADVITNLDHRPAARQLRTSLEAYMSGPGFQPEERVSVDRLEKAFHPQLDAGAPQTH